MMETQDRQEEIEEIEEETAADMSGEPSSESAPESSEMVEPPEAEGTVEADADQEADESADPASDTAPEGPEMAEEPGDDGADQDMPAAEAELNLDAEQSAEVADDPAQNDDAESSDDLPRPPEQIADPSLYIDPASAAFETDLLGADDTAAPESDEEEGQDLYEEPDDDRAWYVVHCYSGYENKVRHNLEQRIESMGMKDKIFDVVVPTEEEIEVREGKRRTVERRVFPGYILVNMIMTEESWYVVRNTPGVTGFVGQGNTPIPLRPEEVAQIIKRMEAEAPRIKVTFKSGERVRIIDGPFNDFRGTVSEIDMERAKVRVMVNFFGRETPVELDFLQVEKA